MSKYELLYDDACSLCLETVAIVRRLDPHGAVSLIPLSDLSPSTSKQLPPRAGLYASVHLLADDGSVYTGVDALARLAMISPGHKWLGRCLMLPGVRFVARMVYRFAARHRLKLSRFLPTRLNGHP